MATRSTFTQAIDCGIETGAPSTDTRGTIDLIKKITVSAANTSAAFTLPDGAKGFKLTPIVTTGFTGVGQGFKLKVGTSGSANAFGQVDAVSAAGSYTVSSNATQVLALYNVSTQMVFKVSASATTGTISAGKADLLVNFLVPIPA